MYRVRGQEIEGLQPDYKTPSLGVWKLVKWPERPYWSRVGPVGTIVFESTPDSPGGTYRVCGVNEPFKDYKSLGGDP